MTLPIAALVLCAAVLHASWNALLKSGGDRFRAIVVMSAAASVICMPALAALPAPRLSSWPAIVLSSALHVGYNLFLVRAYRHGDLGQVYPVARGSSPLLVTLGALLIVGERPDGWTAAGIVMISAGILTLARGWGAASRAGLATAFATGAFIAAYTVTDGIGGRLSEHPVSYSVWLFVLDGMAMLVLYIVLRKGGDDLVAVDRETAKAAIGGLVSLLAYTAVIWAASVSPMGPVSAMRETSVVFATLLGWLFLGERMTASRLAPCGLVALGALLLAQHG